jgi:fucose 4-O-acetylase-like acetyltransferase
LTVGAWCPLPERAFALTLFGHALLLPWLPFSADLLGISLAFLLLGVRLQVRARAFMPQAGWLVLSLVVFGAIALGSEAQVNLNMRLYREPLLATAAALAGLYGVLCLSHALAARGGAARHVLAHLGRASLFILVFHDHVDNKVQAWLGARLGPGHEWAVALLAFAACLTVPLLIRAVVLRSRALAWLFGQPLSAR